MRHIYIKCAKFVVEDRILNREHRSIGWAIFDGGSLVEDGYVCDGKNDERYRWRDLPPRVPDFTHEKEEQALAAFYGLVKRESEAGAVFVAQDQREVIKRLDDCWHRFIGDMRVTMSIVVEPSRTIIDLYARSNPRDVLDLSEVWHPQVYARELGAYHSRALRWVERSLERSQLLIE